jgi:mRNA guanylyltransferase
MSFGVRDLDKLEAQEYVIEILCSSQMSECVSSYWVCEKSDGVRVLLFINTIISTKAQIVYLVCRYSQPCNLRVSTS